jgi:predicted phage-related endonuclease
MITSNLRQGTPEWHAHRATHFNASDAPAVMGCSSYKTRNQLIKERATGLLPEVDAATQRRFDDGHRFEALARPLAEAIIGEDLYPVTGSLGKYSASFDGLTMGEDIDFEHKSLNDVLRAAFDLIDTIAPEYRDQAGGLELPLEYQIQMEQQCMVSDCKKVLFMASKWDGDTLVEERHCWYFPNLALRKRIIDAWDQFEADVAAYTHVEPVAKVEPEVVSQLPAVVINVTGQLSASNLADVTPKFDAWLANTKTSLSTDSDFANGESNAKFSRATAKALKTKAKEVVDQIASISDAVRTLELYAGKFDALGLKLEKAVKEEKELIKSSLINVARDKLREHCTKLDERIGKRYMPIVQGNWNEVVKNKRTIESLHNALDTELARAKIEASALADNIQGNINIREVREFGFLFSDLATLCLKPMEDFQAVVTNRVQAHQAQESARLQAETARIAEQERVKAEAAATAKANAEIAAARQVDQEARNKAAREALEAAPVADTRIVNTSPALGSIVGVATVTGIGRNTFASEIINDTADTERARLNTLLNRLTANEISKVLRFVQELCRQAA